VRVALIVASALVCAGTSRANDDASEGEFTEDDLSCAYGVTGEGASDGTVGVFLPRGDVASWDVQARLRFDEYELKWTDGPWTAVSGEFVTWLAWVPAEALMVADQYDYLSYLSVRVGAYDSKGVRIRQYSPDLAQVAFDPYEDPLVLLLDEAAELAPGDAWSDLVEPRILLVAKDDDVLPQPYVGPARPDDVADEGAAR
jgi:hypothetical protein